MVDFLVPPTGGRLPFSVGFANHGLSSSLSDLRQILRPMSSLSKHIQDSDYRIDSFIPAVELAMNRFPDLSEDDWAARDRGSYVVVSAFTSHGGFLTI